MSRWESFQSVFRHKIISKPSSFCLCNRLLKKRRQKERGDIEMEPTPLLAEPIEEETEKEKAL